MTDQLDQAQVFEEARRDDALRDQALKPAMPPLGFCYNCDEIVFSGCFCDTDCRDDYEKREKLKAMHASTS